MLVFQTCIWLKQKKEKENKKLNDFTYLLSKFTIFILAEDLTIESHYIIRHAGSTIHMQLHINLSY